MPLPSDATLSVLATTALSLGVLAALAWVCWLFVRDPKPPQPRKHITLSDRLAPPPLVRFAESWCAACKAFVVHERFATWKRCPKCAGPLSDGEAVESVPTPDEPPTLPDGGRAA